MGRRSIQEQGLDLCAGDVTIRGNRAQYASFTIPYLSAEIYMLVHAAHEWNQTLWTFLKPFTTTLWFTLGCACIFTGIALACLEYRAGNPQFASPYYKQLVMVMWFPISTFFFHEGKSLLPLNSYEEFRNALSDGSVKAVIAQLPYIDIFLAKYGSKCMKVGPIHQEAGIAFALPIGSELLEFFSRAVINVTESEIMTEMKRKYLGFATTDISQPNQALPQSIDVQCFIGLFILMGVVTLTAITVSEISFMRRNNKIGIEEELKEQATTSEKVQIKIQD
ncbi:hypothetical protein L1987_54375 [Smallanthus sonchifolius]|uniref:Uncharacterized protein n=1 Tax=Smallanthus sonchifolius TaxID=185202 RepID=A0ACB9E7K3_9ASTR|nr:hypothetical protein L1987_54375 [Smallanthus sonchifolius]